MKVLQSYASKEFNEFEVYDTENVRIAYYYEHFKHPIDNKVLTKPVFEIYYDYDSEDEDYTSSLITENYEDILDVIDSL